MIIAGIDEAGRGPVIGPMVMCAVSCHKDHEVSLKAAGVKDSKLLSSQTRKKLLEMLSSTCAYSIEVLSAKQITNEMQRGISLNDIEAKAAAQCLSELYKKEKFEVVFIDSPDSVPSMYERRIRKFFKNQDVKLICENKADLHYSIVGAASIIAKETRESEIAKIKELIGENFGSGYPSDPLTRAFLERRAKDENLKEHIRWKWSTVKHLKIEKAQSKLLDF